MTEKILNRRDLKFVLFELLDAEAPTLGNKADEDFYRGKPAACRCCFKRELPETQPRHALLRALEPTCREMRNEWF